MIELEDENLFDLFLNMDINQANNFIKKYSKTKEEEEIFEAILEKVIQNRQEEHLKERANRENMEKIYTIFAGVNGAGKSTFFNISNRGHYGIRINTDEIVGDEWENSKAQISAAREALKIRKEAFKRGESINQETTLTGKRILKAVDEAKQLGYTINVYYIGVDTPEIAKKRIEQRVLKGGHNIPEKIVEKRYIESLENLKKLIGKADKLYIYDNSIKFENIAKIRDGIVELKTKEIPRWLKGII